MIDGLPKRPFKVEYAIVNLDSTTGLGTHWISYKKRGNTALYFDSFGNLRPPSRLVDYLGCKDIKYVRNSFQSFDETNCGQWCVRFLKSNI